MSQQYILRLNQKGEPFKAYFFDEKNKQSRETEVSDWSAVSKTYEWTLLLPASWVYQTRSTVPSKNLEVLKQSVPYAIEDELSNDVEENHFAFAVLGDKEQKVSVVNLGHLLQLKESVLSHGINIQNIFSEVEFCPRSVGVVSVWAHDNQALLCFGKNETLSIDKSQVASMLPVFAADFHAIQSNLNIEPEWLINELVAKPRIQLSACFEALNNNHAVDLMPAGWLKHSDDIKSTTNKSALIMVLILIASWVGIKSFQHVQASFQVDKVKTEQVKLFTERFGDASNSELIDPYAALQSRMQRVSQSQSMTSPFLSAMNHLGLAMQSHKQNIDIQSLRLVDQKLEVQITAETMTLINRFQQSLQQTALGFKVLIGVNEQDEGRFKSVITMEKM